MCRQLRSFSNYIRSTLLFVSASDWNSVFHVQPKKTKIVRKRDINLKITFSHPRFIYFFEQKKTTDEDLGKGQNQYRSRCCKLSYEEKCFGGLGIRWVSVKFGEEERSRELLLSSFSAATTSTIFFFLLLLFFSLLHSQPLALSLSRPPSPLRPRSSRKKWLGEE